MIIKHFAMVDSNKSNHAALRKLNARRGARKSLLNVATQLITEQITQKMAWISHGQKSFNWFTTKILRLTLATQTMKFNGFASFPCC